MVFLADRRIPLNSNGYHLLLASHAKTTGRGLDLLTVVAALLVAPSPYPEVDHLKVPTLGRLVWFRLAITCVLASRNHNRLQFGFWGTASEWMVGIRSALCFLPITAMLVYLIGMARFRIVPGVWWKAPGIFLAFLWIAGLTEEVLSRGMLLELLRERVGLGFAIVGSSVLFGLTHLSFGHFPNFKMFVAASLLGVFCAWSYLSAQSVRSSAVTHAIIVAIWRTTLSG